jgi:hypothetical protein
VSFHKVSFHEVSFHELSFHEIPWYHFTHVHSKHSWQNMCWKPERCVSNESNTNPFERISFEHDFLRHCLTRGYFFLNRKAKSRFFHRPTSGEKFLMSQTSRSGHTQDLPANPLFAPNFFVREFDDPMRKHEIWFLCHTKTFKVKIVERRPGGVAWWSSRPPPEQNISGSNPARV